MSSGSSRLSVRVGYGIAGALFGGAALLAGRRFYGDCVIRRRFRALTPEPSSERFDRASSRARPSPCSVTFCMRSPLERGSIWPRVFPCGAICGSPRTTRFERCGPRRSSRRRGGLSGRPPWARVVRASTVMIWLEGDDAGVEFYAVHALPVAHRRGLDVRRSAAGRLAAESMPSRPPRCFLRAACVGRSRGRIRSGRRCGSRASRTRSRSCSTRPAGSFARAFCGGGI